MSSLTRIATLVQMCQMFPWFFIHALAGNLLHGKLG